VEEVDAEAPAHAAQAAVVTVEDVLAGSEVRVEATDGAKVGATGGATVDTLVGDGLGR
jgi:hypothetical protein